MIEFRTLLTDLMTVPVEKPTYVLANFHRTEVHEEGGGHFSPLVALDPLQDMVLIAGKIVSRNDVCKLTHCELLL